MDLLTKNVPKFHRECSQARFCKGLGASQTPFERQLGSLGRLLDALGRVLDASWASLGRSWVSPGYQMLPKTGSDSILEGSGRVRGRVGRSQGCIFRCFFIHLLYNGFNNALTTLLHFPTPFLLQVSTDAWN